MTYTIWQKENCPACAQATALLNSRNTQYIERKIGSDGITRDMLLEVAPGARSVPQIFHGDRYIGGLPELRNYLNLAHTA